MSAKKACSSPGCPKPMSARGLCVGHYARWRAGLDCSAPLNPRRGPRGTPSAQVAIRLPLATKARLELLAEGEGISVYALVREIVDAWLASR